MVSIDQKSGEQVLHSLFASDIFSETDKKILRYLMDANFTGETPKETTIAIDVFGKTADFNPAEDSIVRSHIYHLRKKLKEYYLSVGKSDTFHLEIPKGHYQIEIHKNSRFRLAAWFSDTHKVVLLGLVLLLMGLCVFLFLRNRSLVQNRAELNNPVNPAGIWNEFTTSDLPTLIVFGDYYLYQEEMSGGERQRYIRDPQINSPQDLARYFKMYPDESADISETSLTYLSNEIPRTLSVILQYFQHSPNTPRLTVASDLTWDDIQAHNIIFIGHYQTLQIFKNYFDHLRYKYQLSPPVLYYTPDYTDTLESISVPSRNKDGFHHDYTTIAKFPGGNGNTILLICSFSRFGKVKAAELLSSTETLQHAYQPTLEDLPTYFEMLVRIYGVRSMGFQTDFVHFDAIDPNTFSEISVSRYSAHRESRE
ncbi:MAG TPA: hypothetical protein VKA68_09975 [bacterium]|nr:hypothetical protein [bacterium]